MNGSITKKAIRNNRQSGLASVEFAVGTVVILFVMLASAEISRIYYSYNTLTKSVRSGSRYLSMVALNSASVVDLTQVKIARTSNLVIYGSPDSNEGPILDGLTSDDVEISLLNSSEAISQYVRVSADYVYQPMLGVISGFGFGEDFDFGFTMNATSAMRVLQ